jgi:hypothetical protein
MILPTADNQFSLQALRRNGIFNIAIANRLGVSRRTFSRALLLMDDWIETTFRGMAPSNQISVEKTMRRKVSSSAVLSHSRWMRSSLSR